VAVFAIIQETLAGRFAGKAHHYGLGEKAVGTSDFKYVRDPKTAGDRMDPARMKRIDDAMERLTREIIAGTIKVSNYEEQH
jgi:basic membrane lipoprotein Med (substrate-binding protein (PBP1-ABC) superfamily)